MWRLLVIANIVPSTPILVTLMKEALRYFETSFPTRATSRNITEDGILHSHCREYPRSYRNCFSYQNNEYCASHNDREYVAVDEDIV
jgi:hypothetical protein